MASFSWWHVSGHIKSTFYVSFSNYFTWFRLWKPMNAINSSFPALVVSTVTLSAFPSQKIVLLATWQTSTAEPSTLSKRCWWISVVLMRCGCVFLLTLSHIYNYYYFEYSAGISVPSDTSILLALILLAESARIPPSPIPIWCLTSLKWL
jgi:hypothetical protein